jgi:hypothetical protein
VGLGTTLFPADALAFYGTPKHIVRAYLPEDYLADVEGAVDVQVGYT